MHESTTDELARLRAEHRRLSELLALIQELTSTVVRSESVGDLCSRAFVTLFSCVPFDAGVAVMLDQHLDLYVSTRQGAKALLNEELVASLRSMLPALLPVPFVSTEVVVMAEHEDLPAAEGPTGVDSVASGLLEHEGRAAGLLVVARREPFTEGEHQILAFFATQVSMLLATIHAREEILNLAETDDLTGIWNRRYLSRQLPQEIERARGFGVPLSLLLYDIDEFKQINDSFGHVIGDVVLSELCGAVRETLRGTDILARFGGDEFAIVLPHTNLAGASALATRVLERVRLLTVPTDDDCAIQCSVSIGVTEFDRDADITANDLLRRADERLYASKRGGKNRYTA